MNGKNIHCLFNSRKLFSTHLRSYSKKYEYILHKYENIIKNVTFRKKKYFQGIKTKCFYNMSDAWNEYLHHANVNSFHRQIPLFVLRNCITFKIPFYALKHIKETLK